MLSKPSTREDLLAAGRYALAPVCIGAAVLLHVSPAGPYLHPTGPLLLGVVGAAWFGGLGPALFAALLATLVLPRLMPMSYPLLADLLDLPHFIIFSIAGAALGWGSTRRRLAERKLAEEELRVADAPVRASEERYALAVAGSDAGLCVRDVSGKPLHQAGSISDVDARRRAEDALRMSEERYALALEASEEGHFDSDLEKGEMFVSARLNEIFGFPRRAETANRLEYLSRMPVHPDDRHLLVEINRPDPEDHGRDVYELEYRIVPRPGEIRWIHLRAKVVRDAEGRARRRVGMVADITERKLAAEELRESEARFRGLTELSSDWYWRQDENLRFTFSSTLTDPAPGHPAGVAVGKTRWELPGVVPLSSSWAEHRELLAARKPFRDFEYSRPAPDGTLRYVTASGTPVLDEKGEFRGYQGVARDITERKRVEEALRQQTERLQLGQAAMRMIIMDWKVAEDLLTWSDSPEWLRGPMPASGRYPPFKDQVHPEDRDRYLATRHAALETLQVQTTEFRVVRTDGEVIWVLQRKYAFAGADGKAVRLLAAMFDITARKLAEAALAESEKRYQRVVLAADAGFWEWDVAKDEFYASPRLVEMSGLPSGTTFAGREDFMRRQPFHPEDRDRWRQAVNELFASGASRVAMEVRYFRNGEPRWARLDGMCFRDAAGRVVRWTGSSTDITERKSAEEALREQTERLQLGQAAMRMNIMDWNLAQDLLTWSDSPEWLRGPMPASGRYPPFKDQVHPEDRDRFLATRRRALETLQVQTTEFRLVRTDAEVIWVLERKQAFAGADGKAVRMLAAMFDITERKRAEDEMRKLEAKLRQAQRLESMGTMAGGIAHDFNNILGAIVGYGEMALRAAKKETRLHRDLQAIMAAGDRGRALVDRILAFSRSGVGERVPIHVEEVVREVLDQLAAKLPGNVTIAARLGTGRAAMLGDSTQVHQVVMNLANNAAQAMPGGGVLRVTLEAVRLDAGRSAMVGVVARGDYIVLQVSDAGIGIAPEVLEHMFDPFFTTKEVGVGSGLGLSLVHAIVTSVGGAIDVATRPGKGSTFTVYLPRSGDAPPATVAPDKRPLARGKGQCVLVVDDEEPLVRLATETLERLGYAPVPFTSSTAALAAFRADPGRFDAVLTDERMPGLSGTALIREMRGIRDAIPVVLMSGALGIEARAATVVLRKPLTAGELAASMARALGP